MISQTLNVIEPVNTLPISVTGSQCALRCQHCAGHYLRHMTTVQAGLEKLHTDDRYSSVLVSGGCDSRGRVLSVNDRDLLSDLSDLGVRINAHPGLIGEEDIAALAPYVDVWSVDYVGPAAIASSVYGFDPEGRFQGLVRSLIDQGCLVVPHVCLGINCGRDSGEEQSLWELGTLGVDRVVLLVFIPTPHTPAAHCAPPAPARIRTVFMEAVAVFGDQVTLGCMRPGGSYRQQIDESALESGITRIVRPARSVISGIDRSETVVYSKECCAL